MTGNSVLLDTNIVSAWLKGESQIADRIDNRRDVFIPIIVIGEMHYGAQYSTDIKKNIRNILRVTDRYKLLSVDNATAQVYGEIKAELRQKGNPIPENDSWIAATAKQHGLTLVTRDAHFKQVEGLSIENW